MSKIVLKEQYNNYRRPSSTIRLKNSIENFNPLSGPREACEDIVCMGCNQHLESKQYDHYKKCKQDCFTEKKEDIMGCCMRSCENMGVKGMSECNEACATQLIYGGD